MLTQTMVLQKKPQYNTWHRTTTVRWLYSISVSRSPSSAIWRLKMKCFDIRWEINYYQKTFRSQNFHPGTRDRSEFYKCLCFKYKYKRFLWTPAPKPQTAYNIIRLGHSFQHGISIDRLLGKYDFVRCHGFGQWDDPRYVFSVIFYSYYTNEYFKDKLHLTMEMTGATGR